jgi:septum formation protein
LHYRLPLFVVFENLLSFPLFSPVERSSRWLLAPEDGAASSGSLSSGISHATSSAASSISSSTSVPRLLLASASPRRSQLLQTIGLPFAVVLNLMDEREPTAHDHANPAQYVEQLARGKAEQCQLENALEAGPHHQHIVISADTIVWHDGHILNKPRDEAEAIAMLSRLRGQQHQVFTGVCLRVLETETAPAKYFVEHEVTDVRFAYVGDEWIRAYVATGEPMDKAGAYAAQGLGATIIEGINGDFFNVVGLPLCRLTRMLERLGVPPETWWSRT